MNRTPLAIVFGLAIGSVGLCLMDRSLATEPLAQTFPVLERFPNVRLKTHDGRTVRFYEDLIKGKSVALNFMYITCKNF